MRHRRLLRALALVVVLALAVLSPLPSVAADIGIVEGSITSDALGTYNGVAYTKYTGRFIGTAAGDYDVPFEIVAPTNPAEGNGVLVLEPLHPMGGTAGRDAYFIPDFLYDRGFSYAGLGWHPDVVNPFAGYDADDAVAIIHNFTVTLRDDPAAEELVGPLKSIYGYGVSLTTQPLLSFLASPGGDLLDFTFLTVPSWAEPAYTPPADAGPIMVLLTESDIVRSVMNGIHTEALRGSSPRYRSYEVAGGPHMPDLPWTREVGPQFGMFSEGTTPLDWTPVMRALFIDGHRWVSERVEPPPSVQFADAATGEIDSLYKAEYGLDLATGIARDENGNALGGIRLPDLAIGRGTYIAVDPESPMGLFGAWHDLLADDAMASSAYEAAYTEQVDKLIDQRFLLPEERGALVASALSAPIVIPATGDPPIAWSMAIGGIFLLFSGLWLGREVRRNR